MTEPFVITNVIVIDGTGKKKAFPGSVGIKDGAFSFVQKGFDIPANVQVVDGKGFFLIPGLFDCHVHLAAPPDPDSHEPYWKLSTPPPGKVLATLKSAQASLEAGFTTIRNCGAVSWGVPEDILVRDAIRSGFFPGPRILACGGAITMTGGHGDRAFPAYIPKDPERGFGDVTCDGVDACIREVRKKVRLGADFIKIFSTGGVSTPGDGPDSVDFSIGETRAIVEEATRHNRLVATHAQGLEGIRNAVTAGVSTIEHGSWLDKETASRMAEKNISLVTTIGIFNAIIARGADYPNQESITKAGNIISAQASAVRIAREAGINIAMGTDASMSIRNGDNAREMEALSELGISNREILAMATKNAALALGLDQVAGTVEPGRSADCLLLSGDPLDDIGIIAGKKDIRAVVSRGRIQCLRPENGEVVSSVMFTPAFAEKVLSL